MNEQEPVKKDKRGRKPIFDDADERKQHNREYMRNYMRERYKNNPVKSTAIRSTDVLKTQYDVEQKWIDKYKHELIYIKRLQDLAKNTGEERFFEMLTDFKQIEFIEKKEKL